MGLQPKLFQSAHTLLQPHQAHDGDRWALNLAEKQPQRELSRSNLNSGHQPVKPLASQKGKLSHRKGRSGIDTELHHKLGLAPASKGEDERSGVPLSQCMCRSPDPRTSECDCVWRWGL